MPDRNLSVVTYAAGAGLAAIALVYVFAPTYVHDDNSNSSSSTRSGGSRRAAAPVGLANVGNDCFINSVLQALAGLGDLRVYLIRETHRRAIAGAEDTYEKTLIQPPGKKTLREWELRSLQTGAVTKGLKEILDRLNERPIARKIISPRGFVGVLERAFGQTINRQQQDAQEFLQLLVEKLRDEYHAGQRARAHARKVTAAAARAAEEEQEGGERSELEGGPPMVKVTRDEEEEEGTAAAAAPETEEDDDLEEEGFPLEGEHEAQSECRTCGYKTKPKKEAFCMLTLSVPQVQSTTLNSCFDGMFRTEVIEDFKCENCRLLHAKERFEAELSKSTSDAFRAKAQRQLDRIRHALDTDPESTPQDVDMPDIRYAPKRTISRHHRITKFPKVLVIHLSRSIYDQISQKNLAKVSFPERLPLGSLRDQKHYRLHGLVTHKGGHSSGHYQSFRRQVVPPPYSNPHTKSEVYKPTTSPSTSTSTQKAESSPMVSTSDLSTNENSSGSGTSSISLVSAPPAPESSTSLSKESVPLAKSGSSPPKEKDRSETSSIRSVAASFSKKMSPSPSKNTTTEEDSKKPTLIQQPQHHKKSKKNKDRWWRISDDKSREARTSEVLDMEREVYLLFYQLE